MISSQMPAELKRARAHYVIDNDSSIGVLRQRAGEVWAALVTEAGGAAGTG
jgi:dephospho-CoA kinase